MKTLYIYLLIFSLLGINILYANTSKSYCEKGYSVEIRKGKDICYKYDKETDTTHEMKTMHPKSSIKVKWKLIIDYVGYRDIWKKEN